MAGPQDPAIHKRRRPTTKAERMDRRDLRPADDDLGLSAQKMLHPRLAAWVQHELR
jgi:hypothetical protein